MSSVDPEQVIFTQPSYRTAGGLNTNLIIIPNIIVDNITINTSISGAAVAGGIVTLNGLQTLTNKTIIGGTLGNVISANQLNGISISSAVPTDGQSLVYSAGGYKWAAPPNAAISNIGISTAVAANAMTITLTQGDGVTAPSATSPGFITFRSATATTGGVSAIAVTTSLTLTIPSATTIGTTNNYTGYIYLYAMNVAGVPAIAVSLYPQPIDALATSVAIAGGASASTLYSTSAQVGVPIQYLGKIVAAQVVAGTWAANSTNVWVATGYDNGAAQLLAANGDLATVISGVPSRLALGAYGYMPRSDGVNIGWQIPPFGLFGTGSPDGVGSINSGVGIASDRYYTSLTLGSSAAVRTGGFRIFVTGTLQIDAGGVLSYGNANGSGGTGGNAGATGGGTTGGGTAGGNTNTAGTNFTAAQYTYGGAGGAGGANAAATAGAAAGTVNPASAVYAESFGRSTSNIQEIITGRSNTYTMYWGGSGGGGGRTGTTGLGGGAGEGAGVVLVFCGKLTGAGTIHANGGNGAAGTLASGGGGGGGGGMVIVVTCDATTWAGTITANGGTGGGSGTGSAGSNGSAGITKLITL